MTQNQYTRITKHIDKLAPIWQDRLGLNHWEINHTYIDSYYDDDSQDDYKVSAITESRWQYLQAKIKWYLPSISRHDNEEIEKILVHELCHVLLAPEQALVDTQIVHHATRNQYGDSEHDALAERNLS